MCNAWNHAADCDCGFGPPYPWKIALGRRTTWHESAIRNQREYRNTLKQIGLDSAAVEDEIRRYKSEGFPLRKIIWHRLSSRDKSRRMSRFTRLFSRYRYETIDHKDLEIDIPIFKLHSPKVTGSKVTYAQQRAAAGETAWSVRVLGFGTGATQVFHLQNKMTFTSEEGACKLVRLPLTLRTTLIKVYKGRRYLSHMLRVEVAPKMKREIVHEGVKKEPESACLKATPSRDGKPERFPCFDNDSITSCERTWISRKDRVFVAEVGAFNVKGACRARVHRETSITLTFDLPGGYDYCVVPLEQPDGLRCEVLRGPKA